MKVKYAFLIFTVVIVIFIYIFYIDHLHFFISSPDFSKNPKYQQLKNLKDYRCFQRSVIEVKTDSKYFSIKKGNYFYKISKNTTFTCDIYKSLSRGLNQSVIAYSLYGTSQRYFKYLETILKQANEFYKNFTIRIYHDSSLSSNYTCHFESLFQNVDFCNVEYTPLDNSLMKKEKFYNFSYIPPQSWRFLSLGDDLINTALWRDIDSLFTEREIDAVNEWLSSEKFGHIMRDHPAHGTLILAGMWGLKLSQNRTLAKNFFYKLQDKTMAAGFLRRGVSRKWLDQQFLAVHVYKDIKKLSIIHDSYLCKVYKDSKPYPTKRKGNCFVAMMQLTNCYEGKMFPPCPIECRPKNHQDWDRC